MARQRSKNQARRSGKSGMPGWAWPVAGLLVGALAFGYLQLGDRWKRPGSLLPQPNPQAQAPTPSSDDGVPETVERPKPKYDFFTLLPEKEVVIPDAELAAQAQAEAAKAASSAATGDDAGADSASAGDAVDASNMPDVAAPNPTPTTPSPAADPVVASVAGPRYLIQAGAFRGSTEAEALKAKIALTGEVARVEVAEINGTTVHRVRMGPYPNASALAAAKQALASHGISALAVRVK